MAMNQFSFRHSCRSLPLNDSTFRKKLYGELDTLQSDLDEWLVHYNNERTHQGKMCCGRTPMETLLDGKHIWAEKNLSQI